MQSLVRHRLLSKSDERMLTRGLQVSLAYSDRYAPIIIIFHPPRKRDLDERTSIARQSAHPLALAFLYAFRIAAIVVYLFCGIVTTNYVLAVRLPPGIPLHSGTSPPTHN